MIEDIETIETKAEIDKSDIVPTGLQRGCTNGIPLTLDGTHYLRSTLIFRGFAGALAPGTGKYVGVYRFGLCDPESAPLDTLVRLPGLLEANDDGVHEHDH